MMFECLVSENGEWKIFFLFVWHGICREWIIGSRLWVLGYRTTNDNEKVSIHIIVGTDELGMAGGGGRCGDGGRAVSATFLQARKQT